MGTSKDDDNTDSSGPATGYLFFLIMTTLYAMVKYNISPSQHSMATMCYVFSVIVGEFILNLNATKKKCGRQDWRLAFLITIVPWVLMFAIIMLMLNIYPGWISPFSNTFGYGLAHLAGSKKVLNAIFPPNPTTEDIKGNNPSQVEDIKQSLAYIYSDQSVLMNEVTNENFDEFWTKTSVLRSKESNDSDSLKEKFRKIIQLKTIVGEYIWYLLTGSLVVSVGYNYLITPGCEKNKKDIKRQQAEYEAEIRKQQLEAEGKTETEAN